MSQTKPPKNSKDGVNYKLEISVAPTQKTGQKGPYVEAKAKTLIRGVQKEITIRAFSKTDEGGKITDKSQKAMDLLLSKKVGDQSNVFGRVVSWGDTKKDSKTPGGVYFQVLKMDVETPKKEKAAPVPVGPEM